MRFPQETLAAINRAISEGIPFVAYRLPQKDEIEFFADPDQSMPLLSQRAFAVNTWCAPSSAAFIIADRVNARMILSGEFTKSAAISVKPEVWNLTTDRNQYNDSVSDAIDFLNNHGGKIVISRTIAASGVTVEWAMVAEKYFELHPEAFCYIYFTPRHGYWLGASPEILLAVREGHFSTMALAGTRPTVEQTQPWSGKNVAEQAIVRDFIVDRLYDLGLEPKCSPTETITTGNIQHLCTHIDGNTAGCTPLEILTTINPTPALAGYPTAAALEQIVEHERHPRRCYGGYAALSDANRFMAYVNLRCVNFDKRNWCMYVGSGIMPDSDPDEEWDETESKAAILRNIILSCTNE